MFLAHSIHESMCYLVRVLAMLSFSVINVYCTKEICLHSLYRRRVITAFKLNKKSLGPGTCFYKEEMIICLSQAKPLRKSHHFVYVEYSETPPKDHPVNTTTVLNYSHFIQARKNCSVDHFPIILKNPFNTTTPLIAPVFHGPKVVVLTGFHCMRMCAPVT